MSRFFFIHLIVFLLIFINKSFGQETQEILISKEDALRIKNIEENLTPVFVLKGKTYHKTILEMMKDSNIPGVSIAFVDKGKIAWTQCYGYSNFQSRSKVNPATVFLSASLSKPITAIAALHLVEKGVLDLDEDVNLKLKGWKVPENEFTQTQKVTLRRLIGHTAGITEKDGIFLGYDLNEKIPTVEQILRGEKPSKDSSVYVQYEPGSKRSYSNSGYLVIQQLLTDVTSKSFPDLIYEIIQKPCGMSESSFKQPIPQDLMKKKAIGYSSEGISKKYNVYPFMAPAAFWTTPSDLGKFMIALLNDLNGKTSTMLSKTMMEQVLSKTKERLGFSKIYSGDDVVFRHTGTNDGFACYMVGSRNNKQALIVMTNGDGLKLISCIERAIAQEYNWEYLKPEMFKEYEVETNTLVKYTGNFDSNADQWLFKVENDKLFVQNEKMSLTPQEVIPVAENIFLLPSLPFKFEFFKNGNDLTGKMEITDDKGDVFKAEKKNFRGATN